MADWNKILSRGDVQDRRGSNVIGGGLGLAGVVITVIFALATGTPINPIDILGQLQGVSQNQTLTSDDFAGADDYETFTATVLGSTNEYWRQTFAGSNGTYREPKLVLFRAATQSGCGSATSDVGPHYCPLDETIYIDETFFAQLQQQFKATGGDVAEAYVIAHEVGHHVQNLTGAMESAQRSNDQEAAIRLELQADCYAGAWAYSVRDIFETGEVSEAIDAASAVGDDRIQQSVNGQVNPETWTHGSSEQRVRSFQAGFASGSPNACVQ